MYLVWGSTFFALRIVVETLPPLLMAGARNVNPPIAVMVGAAFGHEPVSAEGVVAVALIGAGTFALLRAART